MCSRICPKCTIEKSLSEFRKDNRRQDGHSYSCRLCMRISEAKNSERNKEQCKLRYANNKERYNKNSIKYNQDNREVLSERKKIYVANNREKIKLKNKKYREKYPERIKEYMDKFLSKPENKEKNRVRAYNRRKSDLLYKLACSLRSRIKTAIKDHKFSKNGKTVELLGADYDIVKKYIQKQFVKGMTWDNHGEWHIDHKIPLSSATTEEELNKLFHYRNLQPLWKKENLMKSNKIVETQLYLSI